MQLRKLLFGALVLTVSCVNAQDWAPKELSGVAPVQESLAGEHVTLTIETANHGSAILFIPGDYKPSANGFDLLIHFHSNSWLIEQEFMKTGRKAVILTVNYEGTSGVYRVPFQTDTTLFQKLLDQAVSAVRRKYPQANTRIRDLAVSSFSAGYGAVREILKLPAYYNKINEVVLTDSIYGGFTNIPKRLLDLNDVAPFVPLVQDAVKGNKIFVSTHSSFYPPTYAGTPETNAYFILVAGGNPTLYTVDTSKSGLLMKRFDKGNFHVRGYTGNVMVSHMSQSYALKNWYDALSVGKP